MRHFQQVDVFSADPLFGNPVAVVHDADGLTEQQMQDYTRWTNLSEATFLLPPVDENADYRVRIFYAAGELSFAGHPTLGTCHAWLRAGGKPRRHDVVVQQCPAGLVRIRRGEQRLAFEAPETTRSGAVDERTLGRIAAIIGVDRTDIIDSQWVDNGPGWVGVMLDSAATVLSLRPRSDGGERMDIGIVGPYPSGAEAAYEVRAIFGDERGEYVEDPVTGSLNASLAQWFVRSGRFKAPYVASQGSVIGRRGRAHIDVDDQGSVWVGGDTTTVMEGSVELG